MENAREKQQILRDFISSILSGGMTQEGTAPPKIDFALPKFAVLAFETTGLPSRKRFSPFRKKKPR
jgi:hypothetical protein